MMPMPREVPVVMTSPEFSVVRSVMYSMTSATVCTMSLVENRFGGNGLYIFDEPEAALSPARLMRLMYRMDELVKRQSQCIISTHSPILMAFPEAEVFVLTEEGISAVPYQETDHFRITREFMSAPEKMLRYLFE